MGLVVEGEEEAGGEDEATGSSAEVDLSFPLDNHASPRHWAEGMDMYIVIARITQLSARLGGSAYRFVLCPSKLYLEQRNAHRVQMIHGKEQ